MALVSIYPRTNCGAWVLVDDAGRAYALDPALVAALQAPPDARRATRPVVRTAFWGGTAARLTRIATVLRTPNGVGVAALDVPGGGRLWLTAADVAALTHVAAAEAAA